MISDNAGVTKQTFYNNFRDKVDLIMYSYKNTAFGFLENLKKDDYNWQNLVEDVLECLDSHKVIVKNIFNSNDQSDLLFKSILNMNVSILSSSFKKITGKEISDEIKEYINFYCLSSHHYILDWILGENDLNKNETINLIVNVIPDPLKNYFFIK